MKNFQNSPDFFTFELYCKHKFRSLCLLMMLFDEIIQLMIGLKDDQLKKIKDFILMKLFYFDPIKDKTYVAYFCPTCKSKHFIRYGTKDGKQRFKCKNCGKIFTIPWVYAADHYCQKHQYSNRNYQKMYAIAIQVSRGSGWNIGMNQSLLLAPSNMSVQGSIGNAFFNGFCTITDFVNVFYWLNPTGYAEESKFSSKNLNKLFNWQILWDTMKMLSDGKSGLDYWRIFYFALFHGKNVGNILSTDYILSFAVCCWTISIWQVWFNHVIWWDAEVQNGSEVLLNKHIKCFLTLHNISCLKTAIHKDEVRKKIASVTLNPCQKNAFSKKYGIFLYFFLQIRLDKWIKEVYITLNQTNREINSNYCGVEQW